VIRADSDTLASVFDDTVADKCNGNDIVTCVPKELPLANFSDAAHTEYDPDPYEQHAPSPSPSRMVNVAGSPTMPHITVSTVVDSTLAAYTVPL
jgi:hypothetical protein